MVVRVHPAQKWGISPRVGVFGWKKSFGIFSLISFSSYGGRFLYSVGGSGVVCDDSAGAHVYGGVLNGVLCLRRLLLPSARCNRTISLRSVELHGGGRLAGAIARHGADAASRSIKAATTTTASLLLSFRA